jgi:Domain of unknown function (DUF4388)
MSLTGYLSEYSLVEIFNFVQDGNKTGLLSIDPDRCFSRSLDNAYYISFQFGRIVAVSNGRRLQDLGLLKTIEQRKWLSLEQITGLSFHASNLQQPLGTYLKSCNLLDAEQLKLLFDAQVTANICKLFGEQHHGRFQFDPQAPSIYTEMTGISLTAREVSLFALRMLRDWSGLNAKLPAPESALQRWITTPDLRLDAQESKVWNLALGEISIAQMAERLKLGIDRVQQIGFRLISIGLVDELPLVRSLPPIENSIDMIAPISDNAPTAVSASFLNRLMGFLKKD